MILTTLPPAPHRTSGRLPAAASGERQPRAQHTPSTASARPAPSRNYGRLRCCGCGTSKRRNQRVTCYCYYELTVHTGTTTYSRRTCRFDHGNTGTCTHVLPIRACGSCRILGRAPPPESAAASCSLVAHTMYHAEVTLTEVTYSTATCPPPTHIPAPPPPPPPPPRRSIRRRHLYSGAHGPAYCILTHRPPVHRQQAPPARPVLHSTRYLAPTGTPATPARRRRAGRGRYVGELRTGTSRTGTRRAAGRAAGLGRRSPARAWGEGR